jgi:hypothetical protein
VTELVGLIPRFLEITFSVAANILGILAGLGVGDEDSLGISPGILHSNEWKYLP